MHMYMYAFNELIYSLSSPLSVSSLSLPSLSSPFPLHMPHINMFMQLYYTPDSLETYVGLSYDEQVDPLKHEGTKPDNVLKMLSEYIPPG